MPGFLDTLIASDTPRETFFTTPKESILLDLNALQDLKHKPELCLQLVRGADEETLAQLSEKSIDLQKEYAYKHYKAFEFGKVLDNAIKAAHLSIKLASQLDQPKSAVPYYKILSDSLYLPYASLFTDHFTDINTNKLDEFTAAIGKTFSQLEYYRFNEFLRMSAPDSECAKALQAQPNNVSAYKAWAIHEFVAWEQTARNTYNAAKSKLPTLSFFKSNPSKKDTPPASSTDVPIHK